MVTLTPDPMVTVVIQVTNKEGHIPNEKWAKLIKDLHHLFAAFGPLHFSAGMAPEPESDQHYCIVTRMQEDCLSDVCDDLASLAQEYELDSIPVLAGDFKFIRPKKVV